MLVEGTSDELAFELLSVGLELLHKCMSGFMEQTSSELGGVIVHDR